MFFWTVRRAVGTGRNGENERNPSTLRSLLPPLGVQELMLKLKLQYVGHLMRKTDSFEKTLMLGKIKAGGEGDDRG